MHVKLTSRAEMEFIFSCTVIRAITSCKSALHTW